MADWDAPPIAAPPGSAAYRYYQQTGAIPIGPVQNAPPSGSSPVARDFVVNFWKGKGLPEDVAQGIADATHDESGIKGDPDLFNPTAVNPTSGAVGLQQDLGPRKAQLQAQPNWQDPQVQLDNAYREVTGGDPQASAHWAEIKSAGTRQEAAALFKKYFERPEAAKSGHASSAGWDAAPLKISGEGWNVSPQAIEHEQSMPDTTVRWMKPSDYLDLTPEQIQGEGTTKRRSLARSLAAGNNVEAIPTLDVKLSGTNATVIDQDGRNRALAAQKAGIDLIPVAIHGVGANAPEQIKGMRGDFRPFDWKPVASAAQQPRGALAGIGEGAMDPVYGAAQLAQHVAPSGLEAVGEAIERPLDRIADALGLPGTKQAGPADMDAVIRQREADIAASRGPNASTDFARLGGNVLAGIGMGVAVPVLGGGAGLGSLALAGGAQGALSPVTGGDFGREKIEQIGAGALAAPATAIAGRVIGQAISPQFRRAVELLRNEGVRMTPGQMAGGALRRAESAAASIPGLGMAIRSGLRRSIEDFNRAAWNRVLAPLGAKLPPAVAMGRDAAQATHDLIQFAYDQIIPNLTGYADRQFLGDLTNIAADALNNLPDAQWGTFRRILNSQLVQKQSAPANGTTLKGIDAELGREAAGYKSDPSFDNRKLGDHLNQAHLAFRDALERQNPQWRAPLRAANEAYANFVRVSRAASSIGAKDGIFTPAQLGNAVRASDTSLRKGAYGRGDALMQDLSDAGQNVLPANVPDSGTPERMMIGGLAAGGAAYLHPGTLAASLAGSIPYTSPGMSALRSWATSFPEVQKMLSRIPVAGPGMASALRGGLQAVAGPSRQGAAALAPGVAAAASRLLSGPSQ